MGKIDEVEIFNKARKITDPQQRADYISSVCLENTQLAQRVEELLNAIDAEPEFLESGPEEINKNSPLHAQVKEKVGAIIGPYKLLELIGEGGFAVVYLAEQQAPVRRQVALKLIKLGMDTKQVLARFEAERQALALMDHPGIATVYDAGTTDSGRPYFAMQLVRGTPITTYCDEHRLTIEKRLQLFLGVCQAVQHAHQKGIIHRDLKPSNVMVAMHDGKAIPKLIDFGIAKATRQRLTERTLFTTYHQIIGTPQYMSPEQAEFSDLDVDTRSDIYTLGVLLHELLVGSTPISVEAVKNSAYVDLCKKIAEHDAKPPSHLISTIATQGSAVAHLRSSDLVSLRKRLRGELDWIVLKALERGRTRRYPTAESLANDIQRYLNREPVSAHPPSKLYLVRRFVAKHRVLTSAVASVLLMFSLVVIMAIVGFLRIANERKIATNQRDLARENLKLVQEVIGEMLSATDTLSFVSSQEQVQKARTKMLEKSIAANRRILSQQEFGEDIDTRLILAQTYNRRAILAFRMLQDGSKYCREAIQLLDVPTSNSNFEELSLSRCDCHQTYAEQLWGMLRFREAIPHYEMALELKIGLSQRFPESTKYVRQISQHQAQLAYPLHMVGELKRSGQLYSKATERQDFVGQINAAQYSRLLLDLNRIDQAEHHLKWAIKFAETTEYESPTMNRIRDFWLLHSLNTYGGLCCNSFRTEEAKEKLNRARQLAIKMRADFGHTPFLANSHGHTNLRFSELHLLEGKFDLAQLALTTAHERFTAAGTLMSEFNAALAKMRSAEIKFALGEIEEARAELLLARAFLNDVSAERPNEPYCQRRLIVLLANCPLVDLRDPDRAIQLASELMTDSDGLLLQLLAISQYRAGRFKDAAQSIRKSIKLRQGGCPLDDNILAMAQWRLNDKSAAIASFNSARKRRLDNTPVSTFDIGVLGFQRIEQEAKELIDLADEP